MRQQKFHYRGTRFAATLVAAFACAQAGRGEEAPLTPLQPQSAATSPADGYVTAAEAFRAGRWSAASEAYQTFLAEQADDPRVEQARYYLAESLLRDGKSAAAAEQFAAVLQTAVDPVVRTAAQFRRGEASYLARSHKSAIAALEPFVDANPSHPAADRAWLYLFEAAYAEKDYARAERAAAYFTAVHAERPQAGRAALVQAASLLQLGRYAEADALLVALEADAAPEMQSAVQVLIGNRRFAAATGAYANGDWEQANERFTQFLEQHARHPLAPQAAVYRGFVASSSGQWALAAERFAAAIERGDLDAVLAPQAWLGRVQNLAYNRDWADVLSAAAAALQQLPNWSRRYEFDYLQGRAHLARAEIDDARAAFGRVLASPDAVGTETAALAQYMTAETHFLQRRYAEALADYRRLADHKYPQWQAAALLQSGKCCEQLQRPNEACAAYEAVLRDYAELPPAAEARTRREACLRAASTLGDAQRK